MIFFNFYYRQRISYFILLLLLTTVFATEKVPAGYGFTVRVENEINGHNYLQPLVLIVTDDVINPHDKQLVVSKNTPVYGLIRYEKNKFAGIPGKLIIQLTHLKAVDGQNILLKGEFVALGEDKKDHVLGVGIGVGIVFPPMLFYMLKKGGEPVIARGTEFLGTFLNDFKL